MATNISAANALNNYALFNATDIKQFLINQLKANPDNPFKDIDYLGSNINAFIDIIATMLQQILFHYSVNSAETSFSTALLYENMSRIVSLLNYKSTGKQTSMLPVRFTVKRTTDTNSDNEQHLSLPKFLTAFYNYNYALLNEEQVTIPAGYNEITHETVLYQGKIAESQIYKANGDDFELIILPDPYINENGGSFISDNFFSVYVKDDDDSKWVEYTESASLFLENKNAEKYERRFTEDYGYEFKFGNGSYGKKLKAGAQIIIYHLISNGEIAVVGNNVISEAQSISKYSSQTYSEIITEVGNSPIISDLKLQNTGPSTAIAYPESVTSIRKNAPRVFASQGRLLSLDDYSAYLNKNFSSYYKDTYFCKNDEYISEYLKYYYDLGMSSPQLDSRLNIAQVEFMSAVNFNNIYCFLVPSINTIINGTIPNYLSTSLKHQIVSKAKPQMSATHNLVIMDPLYKAISFGSGSLNNENFNKEQFENRLVLVRSNNTKFSHIYIKNYCSEIIKSYFGTLKLGSSINTTDLQYLISIIPGVKKFYIKDKNGYTSDKMTLYIWNPLYCNEDNALITQFYQCKPFEYPYFYDIDNISSKIEVIDE
jgi:hypothetical protein